jgi:dimethylhistidine N-methyltransferase
MGVIYPYEIAANARAVALEDDFARDVCDGLRAAQKVLHAKYLYDEVGSALFDVITLLPEYGLTRAEERLLASHADEIAESLTPVATVVELGSGSGRKTGRILESITRRQPAVNYFAIDVSSAALGMCRRHLSDVKGVQLHPLECTYLEGLSRVRRMRPAKGRLLLLFLGSSIGNFSLGEIRGFLKKVRQELRPGDGFLIGADLVKPPAQLLRAYDDSIGVTAAFNLNVLSRINRELAGDFKLRKFRHEVRWRFDESRIEMHLVSLERQTVTVAGANCRVSFEPYESIWTESSHKFTPAVLERVARDAGFEPDTQWIDEEWPFAESLWLAV